jgi:hypothetical protein
MTDTEAMRADEFSKRWNETNGGTDRPSADFWHREGYEAALASQKAAVPEGYVLISTEYLDAAIPKGHSGKTASLRELHEINARKPCYHAGATWPAAPTPETTHD